jgi:hypothetical protein
VKADRGFSVFGRGVSRSAARSVLLTAGLATIVAACSTSTSRVSATTGVPGSGASSSTTMAGTPPGSVGPTTTPTTTKKGGGSTTTVAGASPVASAFGLDNKSLQARQFKVEAIVATCMKKQGFDYVPLDPTALLVGQQGQTVIVGLTEDEFRTQYGFGISTTYGIQAAAGKSSASTNPNIKIRDGLSKADQAAYDKTLNGGNADGTFASAVSQGDFGMLGGCYKTATAEVFGGGDVLALLTSALDELDKRVSADPQMVKADKQYQACIAAAGFKFANGDEINKYFTDKLAAIVGTTPGNTSYDKGALAALQQEELRLAELDYSCDQKYRLPVETKVAAEVEKAFLDANPAIAAKVRA